MKNKKHNKTYRQKATRRIRTKRKWLALAIAVVAGLSVICIADTLTAKSLETVIEKEQVKFGYPLSEDKKNLTVQDLISIEAIKSGVDVNTALAIADCESDFKADAKNKTSTARGVYQFLFGTWDNYCQGDVKNAKDNIKCFMKLYPKHPTWWPVCHELAKK